MGTSAPASSLEQVKIGLASEVLRSGTPVRLRALGTSMLPSIWPGDVLTIARLDPRAITVGDILCVLRSERLVIHRVTTMQYVDGRIDLTTRGDCAARNDEPVTADQILGKVIHIERAGRVIPAAQQLFGIRYCLGRVLDLDLIRGVVLRVYGWLSKSTLAPSEIEPLIG